jgi:nucleoside-diphosphate-sugar epimerase
LELVGKKILVTGANGFIGSHLVTRLAENECASVHALVRKLPFEPDGNKFHPKVRYLQGDVTDRDAVVRAVAGCDIVVHTAACQPFTPLPPRRQFQAVNVGGTGNLLRAFEPSGEVRFLLLSTINVHGLPPPPDANAESPLLHSGDRYSDSKVDGEREAWNIARDRGIPLTVIRPACTFGPHGGAWTLQPLERIRRGTPVLVGGGRGICNPIYVDNLVDLIVAALKSDAAINASFIGSQGIRVEWRDFFGTYGRMLGASPRAVPYMPAVLMGQLSSVYERLTGRPGPVPLASIAFYSHRVTFDVAKNAMLLGYTPRISFEEGMRRTEAWLREEKLI